jgi:hypothetical protein
MSEATDRIVEYVRTPEAIRERCEQLYHLAECDRLSHFKLHPERIDKVVAATCQAINDNYPDGDVPLHSRWRHFDVGGIDRVAILDRRLLLLPPRARCRAKCELAIVSVLLDAGAGSAWCYTEAPHAARYRRSEGLAVASYHAFAAGVFGDQPYTVSGARLSALTAGELAEAFQVSPANPLNGLEGRATLLNRLGAVVEAQRDDFLGAPGRLGGMLEVIEGLQAGGEGEACRVEAGRLLPFVLRTLASIWPGRITLGSHNLGDVWRHSRVTGPDGSAELVPFHKLSQWLTYSLVEPLAAGGIEVSGLESLTGLAEYRNGGLFIDSGVLEVRDKAACEVLHRPDSELVVEWRALTVALLDRVAEGVRKQMNRTAEELPLGKVLQGGTWSVGRRMAYELRPDGAPPLQIVSDGTVF